MVARDGAIIDINAAGERLFGYDRTELIGMDVQRLYVDASERPKFRAQIERDGFVEEYDLRLRGQDGGEIICLLSAVVRRATDGTVLGYRGIIRDVTERTHLERQMELYQQDLRSLAIRLALTEDRERRRIATDLHDRVSQNLAVAEHRIEALRRRQPPRDWRAGLDELSNTIEQLDSDVRSLTFELIPPVLHELGLVPALEWLAQDTRKRHGVSVQVVAHEHPATMDDDTATLLFRCARELLLNVVKHAQTSSASVSVSQEGLAVRIEVFDLGRGFDVAKSRVNHADRFGLFSIRERVDYAGGQFEISSAEGQGTRCVMTLPVRSDNGFAPNSSSGA